MYTVVIVEAPAKTKKHPIGKLSAGLHRSDIYL